MLKLMKYELIKQKTSKIIIAAILLILEIAFVVGGIIKNEEVLATSVAIFSILVMITFFIVALEAIITYSNDLKEKSGYMLFMTPHSVYTIMGSKILTSIVSIIIATVIFVLLVFIDATFIVARYGELEQMFEVIQQVIHQMFSIEISWSTAIIGTIYGVFDWIGLVTSAFLAITLSMTIVSGMKGKGFISFVAFCVINVLFEFFTNQVMRILSLYSYDMAYLGVMALLTALFASGCFFFSGYMLNRELSL